MSASASAAAAGNSSGALPAASGGGHHASKPNKPANSNFRQQRLVAWQPIMSPPHVVACLLVVAVAFIPTGIAIIYANNDAQDLEFLYGSDSTSAGACVGPPLFQYFDTPTATTPAYSMGCTSTVNFTVPSLMKAPVYLYYKLTNFYQNHRRFAKSRSDTQLSGQDASGSSISDCEPFNTPGKNNGLGNTVVALNGNNRSYSSFTYNPCGLVPWSMFNDSFTLYEQANGGQYKLICDGRAFSRSNNSNLTAMSCHKRGITWASDADKFKVPALSDSYWTGDRTLYGQAPPATQDPFLKNGWYAGEPGHLVPISTDQDLQVWMRTASLPDFRKLYRIIDVDLVPGVMYTMRIQEFFPVASYGGTKSFAVSTVSWLGGKNTFLGVAYLVVGSLSALLAIIFFLVSKVNSDRMQRAIDSLSELQ